MLLSRKEHKASFRKLMQHSKLLASNGVPIVLTVVDEGAKWEIVASSIYLKEKTKAMKQKKRQVW